MSVSSDYPTQRECIESHFTTSDQQRLFFRYWPSATAEKKAIVLFHQGMSIQAASHIWRMNCHYLISPYLPGMPAVMAVMTAREATARRWAHLSVTSMNSLISSHPNMKFRSKTWLCSDKVSAQSH